MGQPPRQMLHHGGITMTPKVMPLNASKLFKVVEMVEIDYIDHSRLYALNIFPRKKNTIRSTFYSIIRLEQCVNALHASSISHSIN